MSMLAVLVFSTVYVSGAMESQGDIDMYVSVIYKVGSVKNIMHNQAFQLASSASSSLTASCFCLCR